MFTYAAALSQAVPAATFQVGRRHMRTRLYTEETSGSLLRKNRSALRPYFQPMSNEKNKPDDDISNLEMEPASPQPERLERLEPDIAVRTRSG